MTCVDCGETYIGRRDACPHCAANDSDVALATATPPPDAKRWRECPDCAESVKARARVCRFCGFDLERGRRRRRSPAPRSEPRVVVSGVDKSPGLALVLAFFWSGLGHLYLGKFARGLFFMALPVFWTVLYFGGVLLFYDAPGDAMLIILTVGVLALGSHIYQMFDAYQAAERDRARALRARRRPRRRRR